MAESTISNARYTYVHEDHMGPLQTVDTHHIVIRRNAVRDFVIYLSALLITNSCFIFLVKDDIITILLWSLLLGAFLVKLFSRKPVEKGEELRNMGFCSPKFCEYASKD